MILSTASTANHSQLYTTVFTVYGVFWITVLVVLFVAVGALSKPKGGSKDGGHH